jgi:hypothetical protein
MANNSEEGQGSQRAVVPVMMMMMMMMCRQYEILMFYVLRRTLSLCVMNSLPLKNVENSSEDYWMFMAEAAYNSCGVIDTCRRVI